jgi:hypothetical protein
MFKKIVTASIAIVCFSSLLMAGLPKFGADFGKKASPIPNTPEIRIPYTDMISYYGYIKPGTAPDAEINGKKMFFLYIWVPAVAPEIGVRMVSPGNCYDKPKKEDFVSANWKEGEKDKDCFDTWINFERAAEVINPEDIKTKGATTTWITYDSNDDNSELPANCKGQKYNSLLRITSTPSDPMKALVRGLYRIGFTTYKVGEVQGTFLAQLGAPVKIPGVVVGKTMDEVSAKIEAAAAAKKK